MENWNPFEAGHFFKNKNDGDSNKKDKCAHGVILKFAVLNPNEQFLSESRCVTGVTFEASKKLFVRIMKLHFLIFTYFHPVSWNA